MEVTFVQPAWAWLLAAVPLFWFLPSRPASVAHGALRTLVLALAVAALAQPVVLTRVAAEYHAIVLDQSASLPAAARARGAELAAALSERLADRGAVTVVQFGAAEPAFENAVLLDAGAETGGSPLADALALAAGSIPRRMSGAVTLISDGLATSRDWGAIVDQLLDRGIPVHAYDLGREAGDPFVAGVRSAPVQAGESATVTVDIVGAGSGLQVALLGDSGELARSGAFASDGRRTVELTFRVQAAGFVELVAELTAPGDARPENNTLRHVVAVQDPVHLLYLGERPQGGAQRFAELLGPGFRVDAPDAAAELAFADYDLVVLDDLPARSFPEAAQQALVAAVRDAGVGLFHSGGEAAFGDGGYFDLPVADVLPVELAGDEDRVDPSVGLAIILDTSGSMAGTRIELAKQIARIAVRRMQPHDRIGIVEFYGNKHWAVPMQPASNKIEIDRAIGRMKAIGGTVLYPAIQEAYYGLRNVNTRFKHIIVITDAGVEDSNYEALVRRISKDRINLSTILVGQGGHNLVMSDMANWGQGRFYAVGDQFSLVELILKQPSTKKPPRYRQGDFAAQALGGPGWWGAVDPAGVPRLAGYVETEARDGAELLLEEARAGHPLLATWRYGLGRITAFMSEPVGAGTGPWRDWQDYAEFLGRVLARTAADNPPFSVELKRRPGVATLIARRNVADESLRPVAYRVDENGARLGGMALDGTALDAAAGAAVFDGDGAGGTGLDAAALNEARPDTAVAGGMALDGTALDAAAGGGALDGGARDGGALDAAVFDGAATGGTAPGGVALDGAALEFREYAPGLFEADFPASASEPLRVEVAAGGRVHRVADAGAGVAGETQVDPARALVPATLAARTGGALLTPDAAADAPLQVSVGERSFVIVRVWPWLLLAALAAYLAELLYRRWPRAAVARAPAAGASADRFAGPRLAGIWLAAVGLVGAAAPADARIDPAAIRLLYERAILEDGAIDAVVERYRETGEAATGTPTERTDAWLTVAHILWRHGRMNDALAAVDRALELATTVDGVLLKARLLDARGEPGQAAQWYEQALAATDSAAEREFIRIRLTMIDVDERNVGGLVALAGERDQDFRNRAAVALALLSRPDLAIGLYEPVPGDGSLYRQHLRRAEWALRAGDLALAQEAAWAAWEAAAARTDTLYALAVLGEAYREDGALARLIDDIDARSATDGRLDEDLLHLRVEVLIETERYADAIGFYASLDADEADTAARRRLLGLYAAAGRAADMIAEYRELIAAEPGVVAWSAGLAAWYMNNAQPELALEVWRDLEAANAADAGVLVAAAAEMLTMGFVAEATAMIENHLDAHGDNVAGLLFLFETGLARGRDAAAAAAIERLHGALAPGADELRAVADGYERLNRHAAAVAVYLEIEAAEGVLGYDERMRLAWLYSVLGEKARALELWQGIWVDVESPARRTFAESQLLLLAAELNGLADIVVELEDKLYQRTANRNDINLLVRIYTEVGDTFSAGEVIQEYAAWSGGSEVDRLTQLGRVYLQLSDYEQYDRVLRRLERLDPENRVEHIQNIVLNMLAYDLAQETSERFDEIQHWLGELRRYDEEAISGEFEASILSMGGFTEAAIETYRRALVERPEHSDNLLLMADLMNEAGRRDEAVALLQYTAEHALDDNEFVVAVDGIINMIGQRAFGEELSPQARSVFRWTHRTILERIAGRADQFYLYTLLADIAQETNAMEAEFVAVENSLPLAGARRAAVLRELVTMGTPGAGFGFDDGNVGDPQRQITYGRRLIGLRQQLPPEVFTTVGEALLGQGDTRGAERAFDLINDITGMVDVNQTKADLFLEAGFADYALTYYNRALNLNRDDLELLLNTAVLRESLGSDEVANRLYFRALGNLLRSQPAVLANSAAPVAPSPFAAFRPPVDTSVNRDYRIWYEALAQGFVLTWPADAGEARERIDGIAAWFDEELARVAANMEEGETLPLARYSRLDHLAGFMRRVHLAVPDTGLAVHADLALLEHFGGDDGYAAELAETYRDWTPAELAAPLAVWRAGMGGGGPAGGEADAVASGGGSDGGPATGGPVGGTAAVGGAVASGPASGGEADGVAASGASEDATPTAAPLLEAALAAELDEGGQFATAVKLARLTGDVDALAGMFRERIAAGRYREALGGARTMLPDAEYLRFISSIAPSLKDDGAAFLDLLTNDPDLALDLEARLGRELVTLDELEDMLDSPEARVIFVRAYYGWGALWRYISTGRGLDDHVRLLELAVAQAGPESFSVNQGVTEILADILGEALTPRQLDAVRDAMLAWLARIDLRSEFEEASVLQALLVLDAHPDNRALLYELADYRDARAQGDVSVRSLLEYYFEGSPQRAYEELHRLFAHSAVRRFSIGPRDWVNTWFEAPHRGVLDALERGEAVAPDIARAVYELEFEDFRNPPDPAVKERMLQRLIGLYPQDDRYRRELIVHELEEGDRDGAEAAMADYVRFAPADDYVRAARVLHLVEGEKYAQALAAATGGEAVTGGGTTAGSEIVAGGAEAAAGGGTTAGSGVDLSVPGALDQLIETAVAERPFGAASAAILITVSGSQRYDRLTSMVGGLARSEIDRLRDLVAASEVDDVAASDTDAATAPEAFGDRTATASAVDAGAMSEADGERAAAALEADTAAVSEVFGERTAAASGAGDGRIATAPTADARLARSLRAIWRNLSAYLAARERPVFPGENPHEWLLHIPLDADAPIVLPNDGLARPPGSAVRILSFASLTEHGDETGPEMLLAAVAPCCAAELEAHLRSMDAAPRRLSHALYLQVADAYQEGGASAGRLEELTAELRGGVIGEHEFTLWMLLRERLGTPLQPWERQALAARESPLHAGLLDLLAAARLYARAGDARSAVERYQLLAARQLGVAENRDSPFLAGAGAATVIDLVALGAEAAQRLPPAEALELTRSILAIAAPADDTPIFGYYHDALVLAALGTLLPPAEALQAARETLGERFALDGALDDGLDGTPDRSLERGEAIKAVELARLHARAGQLDAALGALQALLAAAAPEVSEDELSQFDSDFLRVSALAAVYGLPVLDDEEPGSFDFADGLAFVVDQRERLFPSGAADNMAAWSQVAADAILAGMEDVPPDTALEALLVTAWQIHAAGDEEAARDLVLRAAGWAAAHPVGAASVANLAAAALRVGVALPRERVRDALVAGSLTAARKAELVAALAETDGPRAALAVVLETDPAPSELAVMRALLPLVEAVADAGAAEASEAADASGASNVSADTAAAPEPFADVGAAADANLVADASADAAADADAADLVADAEAIADILASPDYAAALRQRIDAAERARERLEAARRENTSG